MSTSGNKDENEDTSRDKDDFESEMMDTPEHFSTSSNKGDNELQMMDRQRTDSRDADVSLWDSHFISMAKIHVKVKMY